jgi:hypothetical protein
MDVAGMLSREDASRLQDRAAATVALAWAAPLRLPDIEARLFVRLPRRSPNDPVVCCAVVGPPDLRPRRPRLTVLPHQHQHDARCSPRRPSIKRVQRRAKGPCGLSVIVTAALEVEDTRSARWAWLAIPGCPYWGPSFFRPLARAGDGACPHDNRSTSSTSSSSNNRGVSTAVVRGRRRRSISGSSTAAPAPAAA